MQTNEPQLVSPLLVDALSPDFLDEIPAPKSSFAHVGATASRESSHVIPTMTGIGGSARYSRS